MKPVDLRNATWAEVQQHITSDMLRVHAAWRNFGPGTTREVAERSGISLLTFRPRTTDLYKLGLVECTGSQGNEGVYVFRTYEEAEAAAKWSDRTGGGDEMVTPKEPTRTQLSWAASIMAAARANKRQRASARQNAGVQAELFA